MKKNIVSFFTVLFMIFQLNGLIYSGGDGIKKPVTVEYVDISKYVGVWYEIAKIPNRFQKKCSGNTTAEYIKKKDGRIEVINKCDNRKGGVTIAKGIAKVVDKVSNSKLKVSFVKFLGMQLFWGDYWVLGLDKDYRYAVVGDSKRKYGWILARTCTLNADQWKEVDRILEDQGYDKKRFVMTKHDEKENKQ